jgi:hypothetical protein
MRFTAENLYEQIDGRAEYYIAYDVEDLTFASYDKTGELGVSVNISVFDMGTATAAFGVFSGERSPESEPLRLGRESYRSGANYYIWKGRYYIRVIAADTTEELKRIGMDAGKRITAFLTDSGEDVWGLCVLPDSNLVPGSVQYFAVDAFGLDFLTDTYTARYIENGHEFTVFLSRQESAEAARDVVHRYGEHAVRYGRGAVALDIDGLELLINNLGTSDDIVFRKKYVVAGVVDVENEVLAMQLAERLYEQLRLP